MHTGDNATRINFFNMLLNNTQNNEVAELVLNHPISEELLNVVNGDDVDPKVFETGESRQNIIRELENHLKGIQQAQ